MTPDPFAQLQNHVSLGWPVDGSKLYVLDSNLCPMPAGEIGNIWVGGDRLADGYLDQPNLTQDRFVDDPFRAAPGARMYRTGDLGRLETNGAISFIGRSDHRVNIRGHRMSRPMSSTRCDNTQMFSSQWSPAEKIPMEKRVLWPTLCQALRLRQ